MATLLDELQAEMHTRVLISQQLQATSAKHAWYHVSLQEHPGGGFLVIRRSGPAGSLGSSETYFCWSIAGAMSKYQKIVDRKLHKKSGRIYKEVQQQLF